MTRVVHTITERTDTEWPPDHPLRKIASVIPHEKIKLAEYLVCSIVGEHRFPPANDDADIEGECMLCPRGIVYRRSSPPNLKRVCWRCWQGIAG